MAPVLGAKVGLSIPLLAVEHQYAITEPLAELAGAEQELVHPILRHQDHAMYFRQHFDAYGIGSYQHDPILVDPWSLAKVAMHDFTPDHFARAWDSTVELLPPTRGKALTTKFNGMFAFTIDGMPIMGEARQLPGFWTAVGVWVTHSGGVGRAIAELMTDGYRKRICVRPISTVSTVTSSLRNTSGRAAILSTTKYMILSTPSSKLKTRVRCESPRFMPGWSQKKAYFLRRPVGSALSGTKPMKNYCTSTSSRLGTVGRPGIGRLLKGQSILPPGSERLYLT